MKTEQFYKKRRPWSVTLDLIVEGFTRKSLDAGKTKMPRMVVSRLRFVADRLEKDILQTSLQTSPQRAPILRKSVAERIKPLFDENPDMTTAELRARSGLAIATIVRYRKLYRQKRNLPPLKCGRKRRIASLSQYLSEIDNENRSNA